MDEELEHVITGWAIVFMSLFGIVLAALTATFVTGLIWCVIMAVGFLILGYAFWKWRVPDIKKFIKHVKTEGVVSSIQSLGL